MQLFISTHRDLKKYNRLSDKHLKVSPLSDLICVFPYGAEEKFPHKIKQVGGIAA